MPEATWDSVKETVLEILSKRLVVGPDKIKVGSNLRDELGMDSFTTVEVMFEIEDKFEIEIPEADLLKVTTVKDVVDYIIKRLNEPKSDKAADEEA